MSLPHVMETHVDSSCWRSLREGGAAARDMQQRQKSHHIQDEHSMPQKKIIIYNPTNKSTRRSSSRSRC
jgi:hypothetical protein